MAWLAEHGLSGRTWTVDDVWFLASEDFGPALSLPLPARETFLREVKRQPGVTTTHHVRLRNVRLINANGSRQSKTTMYQFEVPVLLAGKVPVKAPQVSRSPVVAKMALAA